MGRPEKEFNFLFSAIGTKWNYITENYAFFIDLVNTFYRLNQSVLFYTKHRVNWTKSQKTILIEIKICEAEICYSTDRAAS